MDYLVLPEVYGALHAPGMYQLSYLGRYLKILHGPGGHEQR